MQIRDQNRLLSTSPYRRAPREIEWRPYHWMRESRDPTVRWLWDRMLVSMRPDPSDAGMAWFLVSGDDECDPPKLKRLIDEHRFPSLITTRTQVRIEAENFRQIEGFDLDDRNDRNASHRLNLANVVIQRGDELAVEVQTETNSVVRLDYLQLNLRSGRE